MLLGAPKSSAVSQKMPLDPRQNHILSKTTWKDFFGVFFLVFFSFFGFFFLFCLFVCFYHRIIKAEKDL